jgi:hypothetical protein
VPDDQPDRPAPPPEITGTLLTRQGALDIGIAVFGTLLPTAPRADAPRRRARSK